MKRRAASLAPTRRVWLVSSGDVDARGRRELVIGCADPWGPPLEWVVTVDAQSGAVVGDVRRRDAARAARQVRAVARGARVIGAQVARQGILALPVPEPAGDRQLALNLTTEQK